MNPKPFWALKNFTVPVAIVTLLAVDTPVNPTRADRAADKASEFLGDDLGAPKIGSVSRQAENLGCARSLYERRCPVKRGERRHAARSSWLCLATRSCGSLALLMRYCSSSPSEGSTRTTL